MVNTLRTADTAAVRDIEELLYRNAEQFVDADHATGAVRVRFTPLATLIAQLLAEHTAAARTEQTELAELAELAWGLSAELAALRTGLAGVLRYDRDRAGYPGDDRALVEVRALAAEARTRENEIIALSCEVDKLERALTDAARDSETAARFVDTMLGGAR